jgi:hypothetical protein
MRSAAAGILRTRCKHQSFCLLRLARRTTAAEAASTGRFLTQRTQPSFPVLALRAAHVAAAGPFAAAGGAQVFAGGALRSARSGCCSPRASGSAVLGLACATGAACATCGPLGSFTGTRLLACCICGPYRRSPLRRAVHDLPRGLQLIYSQAQEDARQGRRDKASALAEPRALMSTPCPSCAAPQQEQRFKALKVPHSVRPASGGRPMSLCSRVATACVRRVVRNLMLGFLSAVAGIW